MKAALCVCERERDRGREEQKKTGIRWATLMPKRDANMPMLWDHERKKVVGHGWAQVLCVKETLSQAQCDSLLTGPTQLRTITACLHMAARESGSSTSATRMSTSDLSSGLPTRTHAHTLCKGGCCSLFQYKCLEYNSPTTVFMVHTIKDIHDSQVWVCVHCK